MKNVSGRLFFSATDLSHFLACGHLALLDRRAVFEGPKAPVYDDPALEVLWKRGLEHERRHLETYRSEGRRVIEIHELDQALPYEQRWQQRTAATVDAMRKGADVIYQAGLSDGTWVGVADFLTRVERPSALGSWSYEVVDTKLAREAKGGALLQVLLYAELLEQIQGVAPENVHIALGGPEPRTAPFRVADYAAYFRSIRERFLAVMASPPPIADAAEPVEHCQVCAWSSVCAEDRRSVDHLSLVAGITSSQRRALREYGVDTATGLASLQPDAVRTLDGVTRAGFERILGQARIQIEGRRSNEHRYEFLPLVSNEGLAALPDPSEGDIFFDLEGDPYAFDEGIEYLFGFVTRDGGYAGWWGLDRASERRIFEEFIDFVSARREQYPGMHIYHYNHYEPTALKRLMGRHATREREVDALLRSDVFVDLYRVVKQGLRASVESYSIKKLEPFYGFARDVDLRDASRALANFEAWMALGGERDDELLRRIEGYNRDDCVSTLRLHDWLERLRIELAQKTGGTVPRRKLPSEDRTDEAEERDERIDELVARLTSDVPDDPAARTADQHGRWLNAQLIEFHRREDKAFWWEYFRALEMSDEERVEDASAIGGMTYEGVVEQVKKSYIHRYRFPPQDHAIRDGDDVRDPRTKKSPGKVVAVDDVHGSIDLSRSITSAVPHPSGLVPYDYVRNGVLRDSLMRLAEATAQHGLSDAHPYRSAVDLLLCRPPRAGQPDGAALKQVGESTVEAAVRLVERLDRTVLPIQGPPGAGKTYTAARMIVRALELGKRVGVTAQSHKVIANLLREVCRAAADAGVAVRGMQKADEEQWCGRDEIVRVAGYDVIVDALASGDVQLVAGTAWAWSREDMASTVDLLVIDEAGQFSLANALAVAPAAESLILVGDPQQLEQPIKGSHPPGVHVSALEHLVGEHTVASDRGLFLERTWRLHPAICAFTSELFYDDRLSARDGLDRQLIDGGPLPGSGLRLVPVEHTGNQSESAEEVATIARLVDELVGTAVWTDRDGTRRTIRIEDILVVAPYNAQVNALIDGLSEGARVGTVDKFQGQEAPIVIYSMGTSSAAEAPRGMDFLYSPHRLNVATSRARCLVVVVASPMLFAPECRTPKQMRLANAFCRFMELAEGEHALAGAAHH